MRISKLFISVQLIRSKATNSILGPLGHRTDYGDKHAEETLDTDGNDNSTHTASTLATGLPEDWTPEPSAAI